MSQLERLETFLANCRAIAAQGFGVQHKAKDEFLAMLNRQFIGIPVSERLWAEREIRRMTNT